LLLVFTTTVEEAGYEHTASQVGKVKGSEGCAWTKIPLSCSAQEIKMVNKWLLERQSEAG